MISYLDPHIVKKIKAGEVIDRPVSVVKELVENSLDAGARRIQVEIFAGGKQKISVQDDGMGIDPVDIDLVIAPHATSKFQHLDDFDRLQTFGFRGEAMASIAQVADIVITSRTQDAVSGIKLISKQSQVEKEVCAWQQGTSVEVFDLFHHIPVRRKFLKPDKTEALAISQYISEQALMYPQVAFVLSIDGKLLYDLPAVESIDERIVAIFGEDIFRQFVPIYYERDGLSITGFVSLPHTTVTKKPIQICIVNGRVVKDALLIKALYSGYQGLLMTQSKPQCIVSLDIAPDAIDCNVHPRKLEIRFREESRIFTEFSQTVRKAIADEHRRPHIEHIQFQETNPERNKVFPPYQSSHISQSAFDPHRYITPASRASTSFSPRASTSTPESFGQTAQSIIFEDRPFSELKDVKKRDFTEMKLLGQIHASYILLEQPNGLCIVDQHAAHEIIHFERLVAYYRQGIFAQKKLLIPLEYSVPVMVEREVFSAMIAKLGCEFEWDKQSIKIASLPEMVRDQEMMTWLHEIATNWDDSYDESSVEDLIHQRLKSVACRMSVMFGDILSQEEILQLLDDLQYVSFEYCPHGRPVILEMSLAELEKSFKRIV